MFCPKCGGGTYIVEEELVKILEGTKPLQAVIKIAYACRACAERFSRIIHENLEEKKRDLSGVSPQATQYQGAPVSTSSAAPREENTEGLRFF